MKTSAVKSVILLSGGLDSAANLAFCAEHDQPVLALTADYGQRAAEREISAGAALAAHYDVPHRVIDLKWLGALGGSALTSRDQAIPELGRAELDELARIRETAKSVWVPNRNGVLINVAAAFAERLGASRVVVGFNREEAATFPDNSIEFLRKSTDSLRLSTANHVEVFSYTGELDKREIVRRLRDLPAPFAFQLLWSCYLGESEPCGKCESCQRLKRALEAR